MNPTEINDFGQRVIKDESSPKRITFKDNTTVHIRVMGPPSMIFRQSCPICRGQTAPKPFQLKRYLIPILDKSDNTQKIMEVGTQVIDQIIDISDSLAKETAEKLNSKMKRFFHKVRCFFSKSYREEVNRDPIASRDIRIVLETFKEMPYRKYHVRLMGESK